MFTKWQQVEDWIRDYGLSSWRFSFERTGTQAGDDGVEKQTRSNRMAIVSDHLPGDLDEKIMLTRKRLIEEKGITLYGYGKRGKENTGQLYCEVRLVDEFQQPGTHAVSSPATPLFDEKEVTERLRRELRLEFENQRYQDEKKQFEAEKKQFEEEKNSAVGLLVHYFSPVIASLGQKRVAGLDATSPVAAQPIHAVEENQEELEEIFTAEESDKLFDIVARFKSVEPQFMDLLERVVIMAEKNDPMYGMAKGILLK